MQQLKLVFLSLLLSGILPASSSEKITYYVQSRNPQSRCPGPPCKTLMYYFDNSDSLIGRHSVTIVFLKGTHRLDCNGDEQRLYTGPNFEMIGEYTDTAVYCMTVHFSHVFKLHIQQLKLVDSRLLITPTGLSSLISSTWVQISSIIMKSGVIQVTEIAQVHMVNISMEWSSLNIERAATIDMNTGSFHRGFVTLQKSRTPNVTMEDCTFVSNTLFVYNSYVTIAGISKFIGNFQPALLSTLSTVILSGVVDFTNNTAFRGGAILFYSSILGVAPGADVRFINNSAKGVGGAIYTEPDLSRNLMLWALFIDRQACFYQTLNCHEGANYSFYFANNSAVSGGDDIYGASLQINCKQECPITLNKVPSVSSDPTRVCICDYSGHPQCTNESYTLINRQVHSGEILTLPAVVVGGDFGPTVGVVYANFLSSVRYKPYIIPSLRPSQYSQLISTNKQCTELNYSLYSNFSQGNVMMSLVATNPGVEHNFPSSLTRCLNNNDQCSRTVAVYFNISLLPCPPGFALLGEPPKCDCYPELANYGVECTIINGKNMLKWKGSLWIGVKGESVMYSKQCPFDYCDSNSLKEISLENESDIQCRFNRAGRLCGGCREGYSLAIGSSHCIHCPNNNNLALLIFFVAAGFLLVLFITTFNLTVTQGMINGLIFYANIVWINQRIFFPLTDEVNVAISILKTIIAWVNLDFGIESCFANGLTAFWKTWLQFIFPFYIWAIAGLIIVATRHSSRLTKLLGSRAVPVLNTLILLSYVKLLNTVVSTLEFSILVYTKYPTTPSTTSVLWSVDGNLTYFGFPHILLFLAGLVVLLFLWLPYTLLLLLMQWLRRASHFRLLNWVMRYHPVYDAYFAPLKHKHHYWFGVLLLARGLLLVTFASTFGISGSINLLFLLVLAVALLLYMTMVQPYRSRAVLLLQSTYLANLVLLSGFFFFTYTQLNRSTLQAAAIGLSISFALLQFCCAVLYAPITHRCSGMVIARNSESRAPEPQDEAIDYVGLHSSMLETEDGDSSVCVETETAAGDIKLQPLLPTY